MRAYVLHTSASTDTRARQRSARIDTRTSLLSSTTKLRQKLHLGSTVKPPSRHALTCTRARARASARQVSIREHQRLAARLNPYKKHPSASIDTSLIDCATRLNKKNTSRGATKRLSVMPFEVVERVHGYVAKRRSSLDRWRSASAQGDEQATHCRSTRHTVSPRSIREAASDLKYQQKPPRISNHLFLPSRLLEQMLPPLGRPPLAAHRQHIPGAPL